MPWNEQRVCIDTSSSLRTNIGTENPLNRIHSNESIMPRWNKRILFGDICKIECTQIKKIQSYWNIIHGDLQLNVGCPCLFLSELSLISIFYEPRVPRAYDHISHCRINWPEYQLMHTSEGICSIQEIIRIYLGKMNTLIDCLWNIRVYSLYVCSKH